MIILHSHLTGVAQLHVHTYTHSGDVSESNRWEYWRPDAGDKVEQRRLYRTKKLIPLTMEYVFGK